MHDKLFLLRDDTRIQNEPEIKYLFIKYGFFPIYLTKDKFYENVKLIQNAKIIAGIEGTNLHNNIFMKKGKHNLVISIDSEQRFTSTNQYCLCAVNDNNLKIIKFFGSNNSINIDYLENELKHCLIESAKYNKLQSALNRDIYITKVVKKQIKNGRLCDV